MPGGGDSRKSDIMLKNPPRAKFKKGGGFGGGGLRGFFAARGYCPREGHPGPPKPPPPPMKYIVSGTSEQLGMRPSCDPTIRTASTNVYGTVSSAWVFPAVGARNLGTVGLRGPPLDAFLTPWCISNPMMHSEPHDRP